MKLALSLALVGALLLLPGAAANAQEELSFGTLAPDNTPWSDILKNFKKNVQKATKGRIKVKLFINGVLGDEPQMLQKMKFGQLTGGGFSTGGVSTVVPELQVFELPFLFQNNEEVDYVMDKICRQDMEKYCEQRGLFLYIWAENGWVDIGHKKKPIRSLADLKGEKMHMQETEIKKAFWTAVGASPIPLAVTDVLGALQRGTVDGFDTTPIFGSATQWTTETKYWTDSNHIYQPAAVVFDLKWWKALSEDDRKTILSFAEELQTAARRDVRTEYGPDGQPVKGLEKDLFDEFRKAKIEIIPLDATAREEFRVATLKVADEMIAKGVFSRDLYEKVSKAIEEFRAKKKSTNTGGAGG